MKYPYKTYRTKVEDHTFWVAESNDLTGCVGQGDTLDEALIELEQNEADWLAAAKEFNIPIPEPSLTEVPKFSGKVTLRISPFTHQQSYKLAQEQKISLNQFFNEAIVSYIAHMESPQSQVTTVVQDASNLTYNNRWSSTALSLA